MIDLLSLGFVLLILVVSGGIAFVADGLGKKIGKKRISFAGLRPKHVASLGTVAMGVAVSFLTIAFIAAVSRDARTWLRKGASLVVDNQRLASENERLEKRNQDLVDLRAKLQRANADLGRSNSDLTFRLNGLQNKLRTEQSLLEHERSSLAELQRERLSLLAQRERLSGQVAFMKSQVVTAQHQYVATKGQLTKAKNALELARFAYAKIKEDLQTAQTTAAKARRDANAAYLTALDTNQKNHRLEEEVAEKQRLVDDLQQKTEVSRKELDTAEGQLIRAQQSLKSVQYELEVARQGVADLNMVALSQDNFLKTTTQSSRTKPLTFNKDEELARVVVPAGADVEIARNVLTSLLRTARQEAESRGAKALHRNGQNYDAADIVDRKDPQTGDVIDAETLRRALVAAVAGKPEDQVIVASSSLNAFAGEPVSLDLRVMPNPLVYHRNQTVAEAQIDGTQSEDRILAQLSAFMAGRVREKAVKDRMVPRLMTPAPFGELSTFEVLSLVRDVKQRGRSVRVQAVADTDIRAADPLRLEFRVR